MDTLDQKILGVLKLNARESVASIARQLGTSRSTIQDRLDKLENSGQIQGYSVTLSDEIDADHIRAFVVVSVDPPKTAMIVAELKTIRQVNAIHTVSGKFDLQVELATPNTGEMDRTLDRLAEIPGVRRTETSIVLSTKLQR